MCNGAVSGVPVMVHTLSPSSGAIQHALHGFAALMPRFKSQKGRIVTQGPNDAAVVLLVQAGPHAVLLGADLEWVGDPLRGWNAVVSSSTRPKVMAHTFKVAHHGSKDADHDGVWTQLLSGLPHAAL